MLVITRIHCKVLFTKKQNLYRYDVISQGFFSDKIQLCHKTEYKMMVQIWYQNMC